MRKFYQYFLEQIWTLLGMFVAWLCLDGVAKDITGACIIATTVVWLASYRVSDNE